MDETDINYLIGNKRWITVYPSHNGVWKGSIYKKSTSGKWRAEFSVKKKTPKECYDWIESIFYDLKGLKDIK